MHFVIFGVWVSFLAPAGLRGCASCVYGDQRPTLGSFYTGCNSPPYFWDRLLAVCPVLSCPVWPGSPWDPPVLVLMFVQRKLYLVLVAFCCCVKHYRKKKKERDLWKSLFWLRVLERESMVVGETGQWQSEQAAKGPHLHQHTKPTEGAGNHGRLHRL